MSKLDLDKPVQTVSGIPVTLLKRDAKGTYSLIGVFENHKEQSPQTWSAEGKYRLGHGFSEMDLVNVPSRTMKRKLWIVFHESGMAYSYVHKPNLELIAVFGIKELDVEVTEGENFP